ncbi:metallophosphoesterase [Halosimplex carlsbadense 2-9-1]|uniref:Metallophosphoesterase n=1 Tax=Halosimplex carlsbadense 2-9-1 TaxID=797114 RepID=M0D0D3_9EURY|nr:metallophosphoesterase [Halosimplex carlsbadense]ELZ28920.1 metallophosphoesterase [Halosimplex carlsbadense 2-9-1]
MSRPTGPGGPGTVLARLARPAGEPTRFAVVADPHVATRAEGTSKLFERTRPHFEAALGDIADRDVDAVLSPGDLTKDGEPWNYEAVDEVLADLDAPFHAVPGNHDVPKEGDDHETPTLGRFAERYTPSDPVARGPDGLSYRVQVGDLDVVGLNSAGTAERLTDSHEGHVDAGQRAWLADQLADTRTAIVLLHHNLPEVTGQLDAHRAAVEPDLAAIPAMRDPEPLVETLAEGDVPLVLSGHYHLPTTAVSGGSSGQSADGVREIAAPTTCSFPQSYLLCDVTPEGTTVRLVPVADSIGLETAHARRTGDSATARALTGIAAARLAAAPLVDER